MHACMAMEYACPALPHYAAPMSVSASSAASSDGGSTGPHVRTLRLVRRKGCQGTFGFSLRGGKEHGTGFFVSAVETGSEAHHQGLRVGDQVVRVNGFPLDNAVHLEVLHLIQSLNHINLKVRTVGMIPVKEKRSDPLTWCFVDEPIYMTHDRPIMLHVKPSCHVDEYMPHDQPIMLHSVKPPCHADDCHKDVRIFIDVAPKTKLGCGICKGPDWKPGIFVQYTKEGGVAREAGLRPGDQILLCNGIPFTQAAFNDAVEVLKSSCHLDLVIRKGAGFELFPGESSGYNSSASSVNGDMSPICSDLKRLSMVQEEGISDIVNDSRLQQVDHGGFILGKSWNHTTLPPGNNGYLLNTISETSTSTKTSYEPTVILVGEREEPPRIRDSSSSKAGKKLADICMISQQQETTTVTVEVHRSQADEVLVDKACQVGTHPPLVKSVSTTSFGSTSSSTASSSLSTALSQELQRRTQRSANATREPPRKIIQKEVDKDKQVQHMKLMNEFKTAHRRMFKGSGVTADEMEETDPVQSRDRDPPPTSEVDGVLRDANVRAKSVAPRPGKAKHGGPNSGTKGPAPPPPPPKPVEDFDKSDPPPCPTPDYDSMSVSSASSLRTVTNANTTHLLSSRPVGVSVPPPPTRSVPHEPSTASTAQGHNIAKVIPTESVNHQVLKTLDNTYAKLPSKTSPSQNSKGKKNSADGDRVEMISIESFTMTNPSSPKPKPPATYFGPVNGSKISKPSVAVTIGEYQSSNTDRRRPNKFQFLMGGSADAHQQNGGRQIGHLLQSELAQTLSRSNLKNQTDSKELHLNELSNETAPSKETVIISINAPAPSRCKTSSFSRETSTFNVPSSSQDAPDVKVRPEADKSVASLGCNRVTIRVADDHENERNQSASGAAGQISGILKNVNCTSITSVNSGKHKNLIQQKSISFGEITTVISDLPQ